MRKKRACALFLLVLGGCSSFRGYPDRATSPALDITELGPSIDAKRIVQCLSAPEVANPPQESALECRNRLITARVFATDLRFTDFEANLFRQTREAGFAVTLATLGLSTAGALASNGTSQILSGVAGALTGSRAAFEQEVLAERTLLAIHTAMRGNRVAVLARIRRGLRQSITDYPLAAGLSDVEDYYFAGTLLGALVGITEALGVQSAEATRSLNTATGLSQSEGARALRAYYDEPNLSDEERRRRILAIEAAAAQEGVNASAISSFMRDARPEVEAQQARVARRMRLIP
jgi:hypothetical protein